MARKQEVISPWSKARERLGKLLVENGYLERSEMRQEKKKKVIIAVLRYFAKNEPAFSEVKILSKPGRRFYEPVDRIPYTFDGSGITIVSTSKGLLTDKQARKQNLGGEVVCQVW